MSYNNLVGLFLLLVSLVYVIFIFYFELAFAVN